MSNCLLACEYNVAPQVSQSVVSWSVGRSVGQSVSQLVENSTKLEISEILYHLGGRVHD